MQQLKAKKLEMRTPQATKTAVLVIGGAEDKVHGREILRTFFGRAGAGDGILQLFHLLLANQASSAEGTSAFLKKWVLVK